MTEHATGFVDVVFSVPVEGPFTYAVPAGMTCPVGVRVIAPFGRRTLTGFVVAVCDTPSRSDIRDIQRVIDALPLFADEQIDLAAWISRLYLCSTGEALSAMLPGGRREKEPVLAGLGDDPGSDVTIDLSDEQSHAISQICSDRDGRFYVDGVTGSGKTEVFLRAAEHTLAEGRSVVYLVPEIALTHQLEALVRRRFENQVAILHSRLTPSERLSQWQRLRSGEARFALGARSAVFAPVRDPGLFIVDEEHEGSYKSGSTPRYHARQVAMYRARRHGARLVLGSATPSVEAMQLMTQGTPPHFHRLRLTRRLAGGAPPAISIIDLKDSKAILSPQLRTAIRETHSAGRQTILFLNRRGFSHFFHCRSCGYQMTCRRCSVGMTYHKSRNRMICHYCGYNTQPMHVCPECGSLDVGYGGFGTEQVEDDVRSHFPDLRVARLDTDVVAKKHVLKEVLDSFHAGDYDLLLGTQMVAKGLNFPKVGLVGIVLADVGLSMPDFRAAERTFSLITQVAGRAGRYLPDGVVLVQTYHPQHSAVKAAVQGDSEGWYRAELVERKLLGFPPFSRLIRIVFRGKKADKVRQDAEAFAREAERTVGSGAEMLGPSECPLSIINGSYRRHILFRTRTFDETHHRVGVLLSRVPASPTVYREVDVDPVALL
ncbi:MAG: primosomal protein N' [Spirochaetaceae bacterium]|nr:MAG: primosomal protein N' [Spirochaetaceae bacterium]